LDTSGDLDLKDALAADAALTPALRARLAIELAFAAALGTGAGHREESLGDSNLTAAVTDVAHHGPAARLGAGARACLAHLQPWNLTLVSDAARGVSKSDLHLVRETPPPPARAAAPPPPPAEKKALEDVLEEGADPRPAEVDAAQPGDGPEAIV